MGQKQQGRTFLDSNSESNSADQLSWLISQQGAHSVAMLGLTWHRVLLHTIWAQSTANSAPLTDLCCAQ